MIKYPEISVVYQEILWSRCRQSTSDVCVMYSYIRQNCDGFYRADGNIKSVVSCHCQTLSHWSLTCNKTLLILYLRWDLHLKIWVLWRDMMDLTGDASNHSNPFINEFVFLRQISLSNRPSNIINLGLSHSY